MAKKERTERQSRVCVPDSIRQWIEGANLFNKANGKRLFSIQRVIQVIVDEAGKTRRHSWQTLMRQGLTDTRHNSGRKPKAKD
jgi:hypothetical protein